MPRTLVVAVDWLPEGMLSRWRRDFPQCEFVHAVEEEQKLKHLGEAEIIYGFPPLRHLAVATAPKLRWLQLCSAGVPRRLCPIALEGKWTVTNLAGLYGPTIAEHALGLMLIVARQLHVALRHQQQRVWDRSIAARMIDLPGRTVAILGIGNIGRHVARLCKTHGMQVLGCRRSDERVPWVDLLYPTTELRTMLAQADFVVVTAPLTPETEGMLGRGEFAAMKRGVFYINVSRGAIADEAALLEALQSGQVAAAALDAFTTEPLPAEHPFWTMPQVVVSPHYSGDSVNRSNLPAERFTRNLRSWLAGTAMEGVVRLELGY